MAPRPQSTLVETASNNANVSLQNESISISNGDSVVISGISGRFPDSENVDEFAHNLFNKVDMITADDRRWPTGKRHDSQ